MTDEEKKMDSATKAGFETVLAVIDDLKSHVGEQDGEMNDMILDLDEQVGRLFRHYKRMQSKLAGVKRELDELNAAHSALSARVDGMSENRR